MDQEKQREQPLAEVEKDFGFVPNLKEEMDQNRHGLSFLGENQINEQLHSFDPSNDELVGSVAITPLESIGEIVARAHSAATSWKNIGITRRMEMVMQAFAGMEPHMTTLAELISREMGKDIRRANGEVSGTAYSGVYIAQATNEALGPRRLSAETRVEYKPLGVAAVISPWNYPLAMANNLIVPALVAGNTVVFKPSEETPLVAKDYVDILNRNLPEGVLEVVFGDAKQGKALVESDVNLVAFTGSMAAGKDIMARSASGLKRLIMELGGNDPMIVLNDADINSAARFAVASSFENAGQMCTSTERIYVDAGIADVFESRVVEIARTYRVGPWNEPGVNIGPLVNARQHAKVLKHIQDAEDKGARMLLGGSDQPKRYIHPTVIADMSPEMLLEREETFGPVVAMSRFKNVEDAIERANATDYGLGAVVFGKAEANRVADQVEAGMVGINQGVGGMGDAPWVGAKQSGFGFHGSADGHRLFAQTRVVNS
ncbi:Aldehyde Dehydrogenase [Solidesulfovibrio fructosivorans JJ]]|uniref:Aldehyde Dehydrogenase n=1 Tax=Solidesulfovibrio fructosivorans JJ] TaxID=596151 RepID=E1JST3_SOLFR|nr:aldehyde dehydrogenase family protein [Solidesulfovibrio fructosivorans]EFL52566.1 Aldehyde Dehydrogenase [Solidesulfovibrio fructosivorans JJ]]